MKRKSSLVLLTAVLLLLGCARHKPVTYVSVPYEPMTPFPPLVSSFQYASYVLPWQRPVSIGNLTLTLQRAEDSRCPKDVLCIWAGNAVAQVQLADSTGASISKTFSLGTITRVELGTKKYQVTLRDITPYPQISDLNPAEKEAKVSVTPL